MTIRRYNPWDWTHWAVFLAGLGIFATVATLLQFATFQGEAPPTWPAWFGPAAWCFGNWRLYRARKAYADRIKFTSRSNVWVLPGLAEAWLASDDRRFELYCSIGAPTEFWTFRTPGKPPGLQPRSSELIHDYLNGLALEIVVRDAPLIDRQHGVVARGLTYPKRISVQVTEAELASGGAVLWALVRHEVAHACLNALGVPQEAQHQVMRGAGFPDA